MGEKTDIKSDKPAVPGAVFMGFDQNGNAGYLICKFR